MTTAPLSSSAPPSDVVRRWVDAFNEHRTDLVPDLVTPDFVDHHVPADIPTGPDGVIRWWDGLAAAFDARLTVLDAVAAGDRVATRARFHGRHVGPFAGAPATGRSFDVEIMAFERLVGDRLAERWEVADGSDLMRQLGLLT